MNEFEKQLASQALKSVSAHWRAEILRDARAQATTDVPASSSRPLWWLRELLWPCPQAWGALAAIWIVIAAFQFTSPGAVPGIIGEGAKSHVTSILEQRRELTRLLDGTSGKNDQPSADRPRAARPVDFAFV